MDFLNIAKSVAKGIISEAASQGIQACGGMKISGKSILQWDKEWICIGSLNNASLAPYNHYVGLYRHGLTGKLCI